MHNATNFQSLTQCWWVEQFLLNIAQNCCYECKSVVDVEWRNEIIHGVSIKVFSENAQRVSMHFFFCRYYESFVDDERDLNGGDFERVKSSYELREECCWTKTKNAHTHRQPKNNPPRHYCPTSIIHSNRSRSIPLLILPICYCHSSVGVPFLVLIGSAPLSLANIRKNCTKFVFLGRVNVSALLLIFILGQCP